MLRLDMLFLGLSVGMLLGAFGISSGPMVTVGGYIASGLFAVASAVANHGVRIARAKPEPRPAVDTQASE